MIHTTFSGVATMKPAEAPTLIASVSRALELVDAIASSSRPVPAKQLARVAGLSLGTTYNLLRTLVHEGYLAQEPDGFVLGPAHPSQVAASPGALLARARGALAGLRDHLHAASYLSRYDDGEIEIVDIVDGPTTPRVDLWVGVQESAHATAFGKQILASLPAEARTDYLERHPLVSLTPYTVRTSGELARRAGLTPGLSLDDQEYALGYRCVAVPVAAQGFVGSLAVSLPIGSRASAETIARELGAAAGRLSLTIGAEFTI
ncbi:IclR family transcriptional regulator [Sinomonas sp. P10A9]|uniref:IclR family transcriptional regulator n=1 Tax=Sinomonas puerhi TaxID=3238584 RepID=A0AB39L5P9_9MICC